MAEVRRRTVRFYACLPGAIFFMSQQDEQVSDLDLRPSGALRRSSFCQIHFAEVDGLLAARTFLGLVEFVGKDFNELSAFGAIESDGRKALVSFKSWTMLQRAHRMTPSTRYCWAPDRLHPLLTQYNLPSVGGQLQKRTTPAQCQKRNFRRFDAKNSVNGA
jgi:hypothetical protein